MFTKEEIAKLKSVFSDDQMYGKLKDNPQMIVGLCNVMGQRGVTPERGSYLLEIARHNILNFDYYYQECEKCKYANDKIVVKISHCRKCYLIYNDFAVGKPPSTVSGFINTIEELKSKHILIERPIKYPKHRFEGWKYSADGTPVEKVKTCADWDVAHGPIHSLKGRKNFEKSGVKYVLEPLSSERYEEKRAIEEGAQYKLTDLHGKLIMYMEEWEKKKSVSGWTWGYKCSELAFKKLILPTVEAYLKAK